MTFTLCTMNLARVLFSTLPSTYFWGFYEISSAIYSTVIWTSLLITGRKFYHDSNWSYILSILTVLSIIILNIIHLTTTIFTLLSNQDHPNVNFFILKAIFWLISGVCSFLYTFTPVLNTLSDGLKVKFNDLNVNINNETKFKVDIDPNPNVNVDDDLNVNINNDTNINIDNNDNNDTNVNVDNDTNVNVDNDTNVDVDNDINLNVDNDINIDVDNDINISVIDNDNVDNENKSNNNKNDEKRIYIKNNIETINESISNNNSSLNDNSMDDLIEISNSEIAYPITLTNASVCTWYMITIGSLMLCYFFFYIIVFSQNSSLPFDPISNSIDFILRAFLVLIYGVPPSELILEFLSKNILKSRYISISIRTK
ncbi:hypothetical protein F8M41_023619 [Gigaspora margarita]|uniref:Uncharacterized protein n=1 Tax=Gigaspora margarita TaxID=4874 RepID=A0A8H4AD36_GIGMA|nr:hypothetical protein F8M41_023619 [Gigaspora margarita]